MFLKRLVKILALAVPMFIFSCEEKIEPSDYIISYSDLQVTSFIIPDIPAAGGQVKPEVTYTYKQITTKGKDVTEETRNVGATVRFETSAKQLSFDAVKGIIEAKPNELVQDVTYEVRVYVSIANLNSSETTNVKQLASPDEIVKTESVQLPLQMAPHKCAEEIIKTAGGYLDPYNNPGLEEKIYESNSKDGNNGKEYVSVLGTEIVVSGGQLVSINTYRSGKVDTTVIKEPDIKAVTYYELRQDAGDGYVAGDEPPQSHIDPPSSKYENGIWSIGKVGVGAKYVTVDNGPPYYGKTYYEYDHNNLISYKRIRHTLTATVDEHMTSLMLLQNENIQIGRTYGYIEIQDFKIVMHRDYYNLPNIEDYPLGNNPEWLKDYEVYPDEMFLDNGSDYMDAVFQGNMQYCWHNTDDTKDMHPDGHRYVYILTRCDAEWKVHQNIFLSGDKAEPLTRHNPFIGMTYAKVVATAKVKMKDGTVHDIKHTYEWNDDYQYINKSLYGNRLCIDMPLIEDAAEDFEWKISFEYDFLRPGRNDALKSYISDEGHEIKYYDFGMSDDEMRQYSNYYTFDWPDRFECTVWDRKSLIMDWLRPKPLGFISFMGIGIPNEWCLPDIIDGVRQESDYIHFDD